MPRNELATELRLESVLRRSLAIWRSHWLSCTVLGIGVFGFLWASGIQLYLASATLVIERSQGTPPGPIGLWALAPLAMAVTLLSYVVAAFLLSGACSEAFGRALRGGSTTARTALGEGTRRLLPMLPPALLGGLLVTLSLACFVLPGLLVLARAFLTGPARVLERRAPLDSLVRSAVLTRGYRTRILVLLLFLLVPLVVTIGLVTVVAELAGTGRLGSMVLLAAAHGTFLGFAACVPSVVHDDLRRAREGIGVEELESVFG